VLGGITKSMAGKAPTKYTTDASGKVIADPNQPADTRGNQVRRIAGNALEGLGAGARVPQQKSGLASALAGLGAGAEAKTASSQAADQQAKKEASDNAERQAQTLLRQHDIAKGNALTLQTYLHMQNEQMDHDPIRKQHLDWAQTADDAGVPVKYVSESELQQMRKNDPATIANNQILNLGLKPVKDNEGNVVTDENGKPKMEGQFAVIDGLHNGSLPAPASFVSDLQKYGKYAGVTGEENLKPGDDISMEHFVRLTTALKEGRKAEHQGWVSAEDGFGGPDGDVPGQVNKVTGEFRPYPKGTMSDNQKKTLADANKKDSSGEVTPRDRFIQGEENKRAKMKQDQDSGGPNSDLTGDDYLKTLPTGRAATVKAVAEGRELLPANRKEALAILKDVNQAYPDYDESLGKTWQKTRNEYMGSGKTATQIVPAYNTALEHMHKLYDNTTGDGIFNPTSKAYQQRDVELGYVTREVGKAVSAGALTQKEGEDLLDKLSGGLTPNLKRERIKETASLLHDKIDEFQTKFEAAAPSAAIKIPLLISPKAAASYDYLQSGGKTQTQPVPQQTQQSPATGQPPKAPALQVGQTVTIKGKPMTISAVHPDGTFDAN
jgi:hypothetical protein